MTYGWSTIGLVNQKFVSSDLKGLVDQTFVIGWPLLVEGVTTKLIKVSQPK